MGGRACPPLVPPAETGVSAVSSCPREAGGPAGVLCPSVECGSHTLAESQALHCGGLGGVGALTFFRATANTCDSGLELGARCLLGAACGPGLGRPAHSKQCLRVFREAEKPGGRGLSSLVEDRCPKFPSPHVSPVQSMCCGRLSFELGGCEQPARPMPDPGAALSAPWPPAVSLSLGHAG